MKKEAENECKITFPSLSVNESFARSVSAAYVARFDPTAAEVSEIKTAVSEAVTNAIVHGYRDAIGMVELTLSSKDEKIYITIKDKGAGIADIKQAMTPLFTTAADEERSGLGFSVMESFMDKVKVKSALGKGTTVSMEKTLQSKVKT